MAESDLIPTGIAGLDDILRGGVPRGNILLVEGAAGTGKTLLGMEFIYRGITQHNEPGIIVSFEVAPKKLVRDVAGFGWDLDALQQQNKLKIIFTSPQVLSQELSSPDSLLLETANQMGAQRIFIDGISLLRTVPNDLNNAGNGNDNGMGCYRQILQQLLEGLHRENLTAMLSHEVTTVEQQAFALEVTEYLVDTVIVLRREQHQRGVSRSLEVTKSRGQEYDIGRHTLHITAGKGLDVFRRVQARPRDPEAQPTSTTRRSAIGVGPLDDLIGGGLFDGSVTLVAGGSGIGKSILGVQLLVEGARKQGTRGLLVTLDEHPAQLIRNAETLGLGLTEHVTSGAIQFLYECPQELEIDVHYHRMLRGVEEHNIQRLVIDGMTSYSTALQDQQLFRDFFHALVNYSKTKLLTTFLSYEIPEVFGMSSFMPDYPISSVVDNIILMNYVELGNTMRRAMTVAKTRGSPHQFATREFQIGQGGISLLPVDENKALPILLLVAVTGYGQEGDRHRSQKAGFDYHLVKPVDLDAVEKLLASREPRQASPV